MTCYEKFKAMEYNTGSEYDIFSLPESRRADLLLEMHSELGIEIWQLAKYLRLKIQYEK